MDMRIRTLKVGLGCIFSITWFGTLLIIKTWWRFCTIILSFSLNKKYSKNLDTKLILGENAILGSGRHLLTKFGTAVQKEKSIDQLNRQPPQKRCE